MIFLLLFIADNILLSRQKIKIFPVSGEDFYQRLARKPPPLQAEEDVTVTDVSQNSSLFQICPSLHGRAEYFHLQVPEFCQNLPANTADFLNPLPACS